MDTNEPIVIFFMGSKNMYTQKSQTAVHGLGLAFLRWFLNKGHTEKTLCIPNPQLVEQNDYAFLEAYSHSNRIFLVTNLTSVNEAGKAVKSFYQNNGVWPNPENLVIVHDDISVPSYKVNLVEMPLVAGGHRGVAHILRTMGSETPLRIKIGPHTQDLDEVILQSQYETTFIHVSKQLHIVLSNYQRAKEAQERILSYSKKAQEWLKSKDFSQVVLGLNPANRIRRAFSPLAIPVIDEKTAELLNEAVETICDSILVCHSNYLQLLKMPGTHELVNLVNGSAPETILAAAQGQNLDLSFFGIDFHGPSTTSVLTWIESNLTSGAPQDDPAFESAFKSEGIENIGIKSLNTPDGFTGLDAIREYVIKKHMRDTRNETVVVIKNGRFDGLDVLIGKHLQENNIKCVTCEAELLKWDDENQKLYLENSPVPVIVYFGNTGILKDLPVWKAIVKNAVSIFPNPTAKLYSRKSALPLFGNPMYHSTIGIPNKLSEKLQRFVAYSEHVSPANVMLLKHMIHSGIRIPIKHIVGGGGRESFILEAGWPKSIPTLNNAVSKFTTENPAIMQDYAPKFQIPGTNYEFDIRAIVYTTAENKRVVNYSARIYRIGEKALIASSPLYYVPKDKNKNLPCKCITCELKLPEKYLGLTCPKCNAGTVVMV